MKLLKIPGLALVLAVASMSSAQAQKVVINYGLNHFPVNSAPFFAVPKQAGFWKKEGLDVTIQGGTSSSAVQQLALGHVDMTITNTLWLMELKEKGTPIIAVASIYAKNPFYPAVLASSPIRSIQDFKGKTVGVTRMTTSHLYFLKAILEHAGLLDDVKLVPVGNSGGNALHALKNGDIQIFSNTAASYARIENLGANLRVLDLPSMDKFTFVQGAFVNTDTLQSDPKMIIGMLRGIAKGVVFCKENPKAAVRMHWKQFPNSKPVGVDEKTAMKDALRVLKAQLRDFDAMGVNGDGFGKVTGKQVATVQDLLYDNGVIHKKLAPSEYYTDRFLDRANDFDREAIKKLAQNAN